MTKPVTAIRDEDELLEDVGYVTEMPYGSNMLFRTVAKLTLKYKDFDEEKKKRVDKAFAGMLKHYAKGFEEAACRGSDGGLHARQYKRVIRLVEKIHPEKVEEMMALYPLNRAGTPGKY